VSRVVNPVGNEDERALRLTWVNWGGGAGTAALYVCGKAYQLVANGSGGAAPLLPFAQALKSKLGGGGGKGTQAVDSLKERLRQTINNGPMARQPAASKCGRPPVN